MTFDKSFLKLSRLVQILLLLIPGVSFVTGLLVRLSAVLRKPNLVNVLGLILMLASVGLLGLLDIICVLLTKKLFLLD